MEDISCAFSGYNSLKLLPDISKWNTNKIKYMEALFLNCSSLLYLPNISLWNTENVLNMNNLFTGCSSLSSLPNLSKWKMNQNVKIDDMFKGCSSLSFIPDISKWPILLPETIYYKSSKTYAAGASITSVDPLYAKAYAPCSVFITMPRTPSFLRLNEISII